MHLSTLSARYLIAAAMVNVFLWPSITYAQGVLRGNPTDALPPLRPRTPPQPTPPVYAPTPAERIVQARMAQQIVPRSFDVTGFGALPFDDVSRLLAPLAGKTISVGQLVQTVDKITALYRERGYPLPRHR